MERSNPEVMTTSDIAVNLDRRRAELTAPAYIRQIGNLTTSFGLSEFDARDYVVVSRNSPLLRTGEFAELLFYKKGRTVDWKSTDLEKQFPPDAIFSGGRWVKGGL